MPVYINTNIASINAQRQLRASGLSVDNAMERLSSGQRINSAKDDAAGLSISNRLTTQVRGMAQAVRNANDGISLIQTAEGALSESTLILQRIRELSVQSANGIYSDADRSTLDAEVQQLIVELDRIAESTSFNGREVLDGSLGEVTLQVGAESEQTVSLAINAMDSSSLGMSSTESDFVGSSMVLSGAGKLSSDIQADDILINGQSIGAVSVGATLDTLIDSIHENVNGITASTLVELEASTVGTGVLSDGDSIEFTITNNDGSSQTISFTNTNSLEELKNKITEKTGGILSAEIDSEGKLVVRGENIANLNIADSTGTATGLSAGSIAAGSVQQSVVNGLTSFWIREAENLIQTYFQTAAPANTEIDLIFAETDGTLNGDLTGLSAPQQATLVSDGAQGRVAAVWNDPTNLKLIIDLADFVSAEGTAPLYNDRIIAHEMVHAVAAATIPNAVNAALPGWFTEGIAEFIHGADERVVGDINNNTPPAGSTATGIEVLRTSLRTIPGSPDDSEGYSAAYIATKMLHEEIQAHTGNVSGIELVIAGLQGGADLDTVLDGIGINWDGFGGSGLTEFEAFYASASDEYISDGLNGTNTYQALSRGNITSALDLTDTDTGSIAGSDYGNGVKTASSILPNTASGGAINFDLTLPDGYSSSSVGGAARLVLSADHGDPVTITRGSTGQLSDLSYLGLQEISDAGIIQGVGITDPATAWNVGDIEINGVAVDVEDTDSLRGKIAAINKISEETGVSARAFSSATLQMSNFDYDHWSTTNYGDFGLNGITVVGIGDDTTAAEMIVTINQYTDESGVSARLKGTDIVLEAYQNIAIHDVAVVGPDAAEAFGAPSAGNAKLLTSASDAANGAGVAIQDGSIVKAGIELRNKNNSPIQIELGDASSATTGFQEINATSGGSFGASLSSVHVRTQSAAQKAIGVVDNALETINDTRSSLGAVNNRLTFTIANLESAIEKSSAARSRIQDADFAKETAALSTAQIIQQASQAMLAQANSRPQAVLSLLQ